MPARASRPSMRPQPPSPLVGPAVAVLAVAAITGLIFPLREISPLVVAVAAFAALLALIEGLDRV